MKEKTRKFPRLTLPAWVLVLLMAVWNDLWLHLWTMNSFVPGRFGAVLAFSLGFGGILALLISLIPHAGAQKWTAVAVSFLWTLFCIIEYFMDDAYSAFMTPVTMVNGAGGIATGFMDVVIQVVTWEYWRILVMLLPTVLYAVFCVSKKSGWACRGALAGASVACYVLALLTVRGVGTDAVVLNTAYQFDSAVRAFGVHVALVLEAGADARGDDLLVIPEETTEPTAAPTDAATEPTEPDATEPVETEPVEYGDNVLPVDFAALAEQYRGTGIDKISTYVSVMPPTSKNEYTGLFAGKNLILITAEAFTAEVIDEERTPTLYRMANQGIKFEDYYQPAWFAGTTTGEFSNLIGLVPAGGGDSMFETLEQKLFLTMGNQLQALGYASAAYHNNDYTFYSRHLTHTSLGYDKFIGWGNGIEKGVRGVWPQSDQEMFDFTIGEFIDRQPFSLYYMTVSGHSAYTLDGNAMAVKNYHVVENMDAPEPVKCYLAANHELENAMASLIRQLEEAGIADDTVVVIASDHYPYGMDRSAAWGNNDEYLSELFGVEESELNSCFVRDRNALIIWSGCLEGMNLVVEEPVYSLDILPTLSNLFGLEYDSRLLIGRDVFSDAEPIILWPTYSWKTDKGSYETGVGFTPAPGVEVPSSYVNRINGIVQNKIQYSTQVQQMDYFNYVWKALQGE